MSIQSQTLIPHARTTRAWRLGWPLAAALLWTPVALPALTRVAIVEGVLTASGGAPAVDGLQKVTFALYPAQVGGVAAWSEGPIDIQVTGGRFHHRLGSAGKDLDPAVLATLQTPFIGVQVGSDPELPRRPLDSAPFAILAAAAQSVACSGCIGGDALSNGAIAAAKVGFNYAGSSTKGGAALDLVCTGCVSVAELAFDGDLDLAGNSVKAKNATLTGDLVAKNVTAAAFVGDGSKLTGIGIPAGSCPNGQVVIGIASDGKLQCKAAGAALPPDGLNEVSNELLHNQFQDTVTAKNKGVAVPDNTGGDGVSELVFPDIGVAQTISLKLEVTNTDLSMVSISLLPPDDKKVGYVLCDPCGPKDAKSLVFETPKVAMKQGDINAWVGQNPKGIWTLKVKDVAFCLPQVPGNEALCNTKAKTDGVIVDWSISVGTLSNQKVRLDGRLIVRDGVTLLKGETAKLVCDDNHRGTIYWDGTAIQVCTGAGLFPISVGIPSSEANSASSCKEIAQKVAGAKSGVFWIDPDGFGGKAAFQVTCNMEVAGGGWTKVSEYAETAYANLDSRHELSWQEVLIVEVDDGAQPVVIKSTVTQQTCYNSPKKGFQTTAQGGPHCDTGIQVRIGGTGGSCGNEENGCFGVYKGATVFGAGIGCNWDCSGGAVTIWGKGYNCNACRCRNTPETTIAGCGNGANGGGGWGTLRHWIYVR